MSGGGGNNIPSSCTSSRSSGNGQTTPPGRARLRYPLTAPWLSPRLLAIDRCGSLLAYRSRKTSRIWGIASLSVGIPSPPFGQRDKPTLGWELTATQTATPSLRPDLEHGIDDHDRPESVIAFHRID